MSLASRLEPAKLCGTEYERVSVPICIKQLWHCSDLTLFYLVDGCSILFAFQSTWNLFGITGEDCCCGRPMWHWGKYDQRVCGSAGNSKSQPFPHGFWKINEQRSLGFDSCAKAMAQLVQPLATASSVKVTRKWYEMISIRTDTTYMAFFEVGNTAIDGTRPQKTASCCGWFHPSGFTCRKDPVLESTTTSWSWWMAQRLEAGMDIFDVPNGKTLRPCMY